MANRQLVALCSSTGSYSTAGAAMLWQLQHKQPAKLWLRQVRNPVPAGAHNPIVRAA